MIPIHRFMIIRVDLGKLTGLGVVEKQGYIVIEVAVIVLECQDIIGPLLGDDFGDLLLTAHGIKGHRGTPQVEPLQELGNGRDVIGLVIHFDLTSYQPVAIGPGAHPVDGLGRGRSIEGMTQRFAVNGHALATREIAQHRGPRHKALGQVVRV